MCAGCCMAGTAVMAALWGSVTRRGHAIRVLRLHMGSPDGGWVGDSRMPRTKSRSVGLWGPRRLSPPAHDYSPFARAGAEYGATPGVENREGARAGPSASRGAGGG